MAGSEGWRPRARRVGSVAVAVLVATALMTSCTGGDEPNGKGTAGAPGTTSASPTGPSPVEKLTAQLLGTTADDPALASAQGTVEITGKRYQLVADVLEVRANADTTLLRWRLKSASGESTQAFGFWLSRPPQFDSRRVTVLDKAGNQALSPFTFGKDEVSCVCSTIPHTVNGEGEPMYALFPPLDAASSTVDVTLPGFATMKDVPVTRS